MRLRATESQASLTPHARRINVRGAFSVTDPSAVKDRHILLIDDILTTGATARAAARSLMQAGAESVWVATLARAHRIDPAFDRSFVASEQTEAASSAAEAHSQLATMNSQDQPSF